MSRTFKDYEDKFCAIHAREARQRARHDHDYALCVGFFDHSQEVVSPTDLTSAYVRRVLEGRE
jgi:hypothetical protein